MSRLPRSAKAASVILAATIVGALGMTCPQSGPCSQLDVNDNSQQSIRLVNSSDFTIHLLVDGESFDPCNRVEAGSSRFAFLPGSFQGVTVRAGSNGEVFDTITCILPEEFEIIYTNNGLSCVDFGG